MYFRKSLIPLVSRWKIMKTNGLAEKIFIHVVLIQNIFSILDIFELPFCNFKLFLICTGATSKACSHIQYVEVLVSWLEWHVDKKWFKLPFSSKICHITIQGESCHWNDWGEGFDTSKAGIQVQIQHKEGQYELIYYTDYQIWDFASCAVKQRHNSIIHLTNAAKQNTYTSVILR